MKKYKIRPIALVIIIALCFLLLLAIISPIFKSASVVIKSENYSINSNMMSYLIKCELKSYVEYHTLNVGDNYLETVSLDPDKNLKKQKSVYGGTWYDYFYNLSLEKAKTILASCEAAKRENIKLSEEDEKNIESELKNSKDYDITQKDFKNILRYENISDKYKEFLASKLSRNDFDQYYNNNRTQYDCVDYKRVVVYVDMDSTDGSEKSIEEATLKASQKAEDLLIEIVSEGFDEPVKKYLSEIGSEETIEDLTFKSQRYYEETQFTDWAFNEERKNEDAVIFAGKYQFSIYYLEKTPYPYDYTLKEGTVVLGKYDSSNPKAVTELKTKLENQVKNDEDLLKFCSENNFKNIGLSKLYKDDLPEPVSDWFYSENRKKDEIEVCTFGKNIYIMKYEKSGDSYFETKLKEDCQETEYAKTVEKLISETNLILK